MKDNWNLHHLNLDHKEYSDISNHNNFVCLNKDSHNKIHILFLADWKSMNLDSKTKDILERMDKLNANNIEPLLFACHLDYHIGTCKLITQTEAKKLKLPTDEYGMIYWHPNTEGSDSNQPIDSLEWWKYQSNKNGWKTRKDRKIGMELRHLCLYSSLKNLIRDDIKKKWNQDRYNNTLQTLIRELKNTTILLRQAFPNDYI